jgi:hypothetical protein
MPFSARLQPFSRALSASKQVGGRVLRPQPQQRNIRPAAHLHLAFTTTFHHQHLPPPRSRHCDLASCTSTPPCRAHRSLIKPPSIMPRIKSQTGVTDKSKTTKSTDKMPKAKATATKKSRGVEKKKKGAHPPQILTTKPS